MYSRFIPFLLLIGLGYFLKQKKLFQEQEAFFLKKLIFNLSFPALVFISLKDSSLSMEYLRVPLLTMALMATMGLIALLCGKVFRFKPEATAILIATTILGNTGFLGYPLVEAFFGKRLLPYGIFYDQTSAIIFIVVVLWLLSLLVAGEQKKEGFTFLLRTPPLLALILGLILIPVPLPGPLMQTLELLGNTTTPLVMLYLGLTLEITFSLNEVRLLGMAAALKLLLLPLLALGLSVSSNSSADVTRVMIFQGAMPTAMVTAIYGAEIGLGVQVLARIITLTTILSPFTLAAVSYFLL